VKLPGPKTCASQGPSRPIPTAIDAVIDSSDVLLLQYAYSNKMWNNVISAVIQKLPSIYGLPLYAGPLRHAILSLSATYIGSEVHIDQTEFHCHKARLMLINRLATPTVVNELDVLATFVLALQAWTCGARSREISVHVRGCASMLQELASESRLSNVLRVFGPLIFDYLIQLDLWVKFDAEETFQTRCAVFGDGSNFQQRLAYVSAIRTDFHGTEWDSAVGWTLHTTALFLFDMVFCMMMRTTYYAISLESRITTSYLHMVKAQLFDPAFQFVLSSARQWRQKGPIRYSPLDQR
jgi:hypothetical protein